MAFINSITKPDFIYKPIKSMRNNPCLIGKIKFFLNALAQL